MQSVLGVKNVPKEAAMEQVISIIKETYHSMWGLLSETAPKVIAAAIVVVAGLLVARAAKAALHHALQAVKFETLAGKMGIASALKRSEIDKSSSEILCTVV